MNLKTVFKIEKVPVVVKNRILLVALTDNVAL